MFQLRKLLKVGQTTTLCTAEDYIFLIFKQVLCFFGRGSYLDFNQGLCFLFSRFTMGN